MGMILRVSDRAVEQLKSMLEERGAAAGVGLRLAVRRGGCAGWQYEMGFAEREDGDEVVEKGGVCLYVAGDSVEKLRGCVVDYSDGLSDAGFKIENPNAARSCGCGTSFETADEATAVADGEECGK